MLQFISKKYMQSEKEYIDVISDEGFSLCKLVYFGNEWKCVFSEDTQLSGVDMLDIGVKLKQLDI